MTEAIQPLRSIFKFSPKSPRQKPGLQQGAAILTASLSWAGKQSRSYHQSQSLIFILFHPSCTSVGQNQAYPCSLPFLNSLEKRASKSLLLLAPSHLGKQGLLSELQQRPWPLLHGQAHFSSTVFFHVSDRSLTWHQHPWLTPVLF